MKNDKPKIKISWVQQSCPPEEIDFRLQETFKILIPEKEILDFLSKQSNKNKKYATHRTVSKI